MREKAYCALFSPVRRALLKNKPRKSTEKEKIILYQIPRHFYNRNLGPFE
jgi:hypothetical protein